MKRGFTWRKLIVAVSIGSVLMVPLAGNAKESDEIQKKINEITQRQKDAERRKLEAEQAQSHLASKLEEEQKSFEQLQAEIEEQGRKLDELNNQVAATELQLQISTEELAAAEERIEQRDKMLKSRVQLMYVNGTVSYLDVLFSSNSFGDFVERFQSLTTIVGNDKQILDANKADRDSIAVNKAVIEEQLAQVQALYAEAGAIQATLLKKEKQKEVAIASLANQKQNALHEEEEQDGLVLELIRQKQELRRKLEEAKAKENRAAAAKKQTFAYTGGKLAWPVPDSTNITSEFGYRIDPIKKINKLHKGIDIAAPRGTRIVAAEDGEVVLASWVNGYGNTVVIDHGNNVFTWYAHMSKISVNEGDSVRRGETKIGEVGSTGDSTGNHLHFEVRKGETPYNPLEYLK